jgi:diaminopimelate decarboxylase
MSIDVIREEAALPALTTGDQVVLHPVGAYNLSQSMQFITYRPAVVMIGLDGAVHLIRRREDLNYVQELEEIPAHLHESGSDFVMEQPSTPPADNSPIIPFRKNA